MSLILNIDTATETASVCIAKEGVSLALRTSTFQKDHASWIQPAIMEVLQEAGLSLGEIQAVAVTAGPGSYTGLRVGMATAKGLCYTLKIPLLTANTLYVMAFANRENRLHITDSNGAYPLLYCPMIDARRMEVFTALYDEGMKEIMPPAAVILEPSTFKEALNNHTIYFTGSGTGKWKHLCTHPNARYSDTDNILAPYLAKIASGLYLQRKFADLAYAGPVYLKEFYSHNKK
jgi:universal bacterial protein YeaZ